MTKTLFRVIATNVLGARNLERPELGLQEGVLYDVVADIRDAVTERMPTGGSSGYLVRNTETGTVLPQIYRRDRFVKESDASQTSTNSYAHERAAPASAYASADVNPAPDATGDRPERFNAGDVVICVDAEGARSFSKPETMLEEDEEYRILADVTNGVTARKPEGGASGYVVQRTEDDAVLAGVWNRRRFAAA